MAEMVEEHEEQVYIKEVNYYTTFVTAASEEKAKWKAMGEHTTLEGYEHLDSSLRFYTGDFIHRTTNENDDEPEEILDQLQADYAVFALQPEKAARVVKLFAQAAQLLFHLALSLFASCVAQRISACLLYTSPSPRDRG